jgi:hypothetical protein
VTDRLRLRIRPDWDAALTYDALDPEKSAAKSDPIFVGREELIEPLVTEIAGAETRGTYLISGYRGSGKTTLLIAALLRAQKVLSQRHQTLFPLVLNVSEISASLTTPTPAAPGKADGVPKTGSNLQVDPRRLLTALLRAVNQRLPLIPAHKREALQDLSERAAFAYQKATASKFTQAATQADESVRSATRALTLATEDKNVLKTIAWAAGCTALVLEGVAWFGPMVGWLHAGALALAGVTALSISASLKLEHSRKRTDARQLAIEHDNSLQQLETDLKDMLVDLKRAGLRTVVVMEELDKIEDESGEQLDAVIKYFKNLFTQAPALFFFVTDRRYFDVISSAIKRARRQRSYAIQHTFFTHRIFVGRPTTQECLQFIRAAASDENDRQAIDAAATMLGKPAATPQTYAAPTTGTAATTSVPPATGVEATRPAPPAHDVVLGQWLRVVLFRAANHLFDLKNELRRFVEEEDENRYFGIDANKLPEQAAALAKFQDLIEFKRITYEIKGGRAYANEVLNDCLYAVFNELGASRTQKADEFFPSVDAGPVHDPGAARLPKADGSLVQADAAQTQVLLAEQLDPSEVDRVQEAVMSLIGDLERGRAFASRSRTDNAFVWRPDAAKAFSYVRQLEPHEESLLNELSRQAGLLAPLAATRGLLTPADEERAKQWSGAIEQRARELREAKLDPVSRDAATDEVRSLQQSYASWFGTILNDLIRTLNAAYPSFLLFPVSTGIGGGLQYVQPPSGDPRYMPSTPRGGVVLAYGQTEQLIEDFWSFVSPQTQPPISPLDRVGIVHIIHAAGNLDDAKKECRERWLQSRSARAGVLPGLALAVDVVALTEPATGPPLPGHVDRIAARVMALGYWAQSASRPLPPLPGNMPRMHDAQLQALGEWLRSDKPVIELFGGEPPSRMFDERDRVESALGAPLIDVGWLPPPGPGFPLSGIVGNELARMWTPVLTPGSAFDAIGNWVLQTRRAVLFLQAVSDPLPELTGEIAAQLDKDARLMLIRSGDSSLFPQFNGMLTNYAVQTGYVP